MSYIALDDQLRMEFFNETRDLELEAIEVNGEPWYANQAESDRYLSPCLEFVKSKVLPVCPESLQRMAVVRLASWVYNGHEPGDGGVMSLASIWTKLGLASLTNAWRRVPPARTL